MKFLKSIKWRLQLWYGLILVAVLVGFGVTAYQLEYGRQMRRIDTELHLRFGILADALRPPPPRRGPNRFDQLPPDQMPNDLPERDQRPPREFQLPPRTADFFDTNDPNGFYFLITRDGNEIGRSKNVPAQTGIAYARRFPLIENLPPDLPKKDSSVEYNGSLQTDAESRGQRFAVGQTPPYMRGTFREIWTDLPSGEWILVGKNVTPELKELHHSALNLAAVGALTLLGGLAGGGWFISRAIRPISEISSAATKISAGDLSQRINSAETESELGQLAAVLNSTFARLDAAFAQQKQFASDAAHELRTPVSVILTQTQTALNRERDNASYKQTVEACQRAAQRMRRLIESLLELARLDAGQEVLKRLRFDFSKTISDCAELVKPLADERRVKIISELAPLEITGDADRLAQVVTNLLTNAIQYNRDGGEVRVKLESQSGLAVLTVSDTGQGIPAEDLPRVFERFYRADKSRTGNSAGLGLAISKAIVTAHGGTIDAASAENAGATFIVRLPVA